GMLRGARDGLPYWVREPHGGHCNAINKGIRRATGDAIAYINSDDYYESGAFAAVANAFASAPATRWVAGTRRYVHPYGTVELVLRPELPGGTRPRWLRTSWYVPQASSFWRRDVFDEFGLLREDLHYVFDTEFGLRLALGGVLPIIVDAEL